MSDPNNPGLKEFFYDDQIRRFLIQFAKIFSNWQVENGKDPRGMPIYQRVPIMYGDSSRQASTIIANNSASSIPSAPLITYYVSGLEYNQRWTQDPTFVEKLPVRQRAYDEETGEFLPEQSQAFTLERIMPVPYTLRCTVDFWTTNYAQKLQLIEQIGTLFNPALEIQSTDNFVDWTSLSAVWQDGLTFSSRSIPVGTGNPIDIMSWKFYMPIWLTPPARLKKLGVIQKIIASIHDGDSIDDIIGDQFLLGSRVKVTPYGYKVLLLGNQLQLLPQDTAFFPGNDKIAVPENPEGEEGLGWTGYLEAYGNVQPGISQIWLQNPNFPNEDIVGTIVPDPLDDRFLIYNIDEDTLPQNTLDNVFAIIDPTKSGPNAGLPGPVNGTRYLIVDDVGSPGDSSVAWGGLVAKANDIVEYNANEDEWFVAFNSGLETDFQYVTNLKTNTQYRFDTDKREWVKSYEGWYYSGDFSIVI